MEHKIKTHLVELGLEPHKRGFDLLVDLIITFKEDSRITLKEVYRKLAKKYDIANDTVKSNLRYTLQDLDKDKFDKEFRGDVVSFKFFAKNFIAKYL